MIQILESKIVKDTYFENRKILYNWFSPFHSQELHIKTATKPYHNRVVWEHRLKKIKQITVNIRLKLREGQVLLDGQLYVTRQQSFNVDQRVFHPVTEGGHAIAKEYAKYRNAVLSIYLHGAWTYGHDLYVFQQPTTNKTL